VGELLVAIECDEWLVLFTQIRWVAYQ